MNYLDWLILAAVGIGAWRGFSTGLIREFARIAGLFVAFLLSVHLMNPAGLLVGASFPISERIAPLVGFVVVFLAVLIVVFAVARLVEYLVGALKLGPVNRVLGGVMGAVRSAFFVSVLLLVIGALGFPGQQTRAGSLLYEPVNQIAQAAWQTVSGRVPELGRLAPEFVPVRPIGPVDEAGNR